MTANFKKDSIENMESLLELQPDRPILVSEYWSGWFDHWFEPVHNNQTVVGTNCNKGVQSKVIYGHPYPAPNFLKQLKDS